MKYNLLFIVFSSMLVAADGDGPPAVGAKGAAKTTPGRNAGPAAGAKGAAKTTPRKSAKPPAARNDLIGEWYGVKVEWDGRQPVSNDIVRSSYAIFEADRMFLILEGKRHGPAYYRVNQAVKPYQVDFWGTTPEGEYHTSRGIYRIQDDKLWVCGVWDNDRRPTSFTTSAGSQAVLVIARRKSR